MNFKIFNEQDKTVFENEIISMLSESDNDFVPPISARSSTLDKSFNGTPSESGILSYYREMKRQSIIGAFEDGELLGFVSYRENFISEEIDVSQLPNIYISTLVLAKKARGKGITKKLYSYLFSELYPERNIFTRTWSTNFAHINILSAFTFTEILRKENDRGAGIDTLYFKKQRENNLH